MKKITLLFMTFIMAFAINGWGQERGTHWTESFENPEDTWSGYTTGTITFQQSGDWDFVSVYPESSTNSYDGIKACRINDDVSGASITTPSVNSIGTITFYYKRPFTGTGTFSLQKSVDGGSYTELTTQNFDNTTSYALFSYDVNDASDNIRLKIVNDDNTSHLDIDYVTLTDYSASTPSISLSTSILSGFYYVQGNGPSVEQSFTTEGSNLTTDITLTPPTNYEISLLTGGAFAPTNPITLTQSGGAVSSTTIYTRLKAGLSAADYDGEDITASSTGATDKTVTCSGSVEAPATTTLPYEENFDTDLGDCYTYSVTGDTRNWYWTSGYAKMNGYNSGEVEEDWLILPGIDFDGSYDYMRFDTWGNYGSDDENNYLKLMYSTDYSGLGDPSTATWTEISFTQPSANATWTSSGNIWLSEIPGSAYIAFKYHYEAGSYKWWQVDNILIHDAPPVPLGSTGIIIAVLLISAVLIIRRGKLI